MRNKSYSSPEESKQVELLLFNPREIDLKFLRELPEINIASVTAIPEKILKSGFFSSEETAEKKQTLV